MLEFAYNLAVAVSYILLPYLHMCGMNLDTDVICDFILRYPHWKSAGNKTCSHTLHQYFCALYILSSIMVNPQFTGSLCIKRFDFPWIIFYVEYGISFSILISENRLKCIICNYLNSDFLPYFDFHFQIYSSTVQFVWYFCVLVQNVNGIFSIETATKQTKPNLFIFSVKLILSLLYLEFIKGVKFGWRISKGALASFDLKEY